MAAPPAPKATNPNDDPLQAAIDYVLGGALPTGVTEIKGLLLPTNAPDEIRCKELLGIFEDYAKRDNVNAPLSIAVFGPPGSGKSTLVRKLLASCDQFYEPPIPVNLSQLSDAKELASYFRTASEHTPTSKIRPIFFD